MAVLAPCVGFAALPGADPPRSDSGLKKVWGAAAGPGLAGSGRAVAVKTKAGAAEGNVAKGDVAGGVGVKPT